jgi:hypothetical protein
MGSAKFSHLPGSAHDFSYAQRGAPDSTRTHAWP